MSVESTMRALLANDAGVTALVGSRIAQNAVPQGEDFPLVVFASAHNPTFGLDNTLLADDVTFSIQCWAADGVVADEVADAVALALAADADVIGRETAYDEEMKLDCTVLTAQWWVV